MSTRRVPAPLWGILNLPFGATSGFVSVMLGFILKKQGMSDAVIASLVAVNLLPHTWKVLWAPIADSTLTRKRYGCLRRRRTAVGRAMLTRGRPGAPPRERDQGNTRDGRARRGSNVGQAR